MAKRGGGAKARSTGTAAGRGVVAPSRVLRLLDDAFDHRAWHGPNLLGSIRGVAPEEAGWRAGPGRPCIDEIVVHCAYWKHRVLVRIATPGSRVPERFPRAGRDWFAAPERPTAAAWRSDVALLKRTHAALREAASLLDERALERAGARQKQIRRQHLEGIAFHDVYHAGQIRLLRKLYAQATG